ncbi:MAG: tripartite tricarboxylate transporter substrate-binding protein, partial [Xanthobacteraceae bacterium]
AETLPGFEAVAWFGVVAPAGTPAAILDKINADINEALRQPEILDKFAALTAEKVGGTRQETAAYMREEVERWKKVITAANVTLQ